MSGYLHGIEVIEVDDGPRSVPTVSSSVIGVVGTVKTNETLDGNTRRKLFEWGSPILLTSPAKAKSLFGEPNPADGCTLPLALDGIFAEAGAVVIAIPVEKSSGQSATATRRVTRDTESTPQENLDVKRIVGEVSATGKTGISAFLDAQSVTGLTPRILIAPHFSKEKSVLLALKKVATRLRAIVIADGPDSVDEATLQAHLTEDVKSDRVYLVSPWVLVPNPGEPLTPLVQPPSPRVAGLLAKVDNEKGFWWSPSNKVLQSILGTSVPVDFQMGDSSSTANLLNEKGIATIIAQDGFRLWGNRTTAKDGKFQFLSVRRTADILNESVLRAHLWAIDRNITKTYIEEVMESVNAFLRELRAKSAIINGKCWIEPEKNPPSAIERGEIHFNFDFTPPYPAERISFQSVLTNRYLKEVFS